MTAPRAQVSVPDPLARAALRRVGLACGAVSAAALVAAAVRVLPWLLDPAVPPQAAAPFARTLAALAFEVALLVGWPVGWALAAQRLVERGEGRVLAMLGERPSRTLMRVVPQGAALAAALAIVSFVGGRYASEPGRVVRELLSQTRAACASSDKPDVFAVPIAEAAWLCTPGATPRLVGRGPGAMSAVVYTAREVTPSGDLSRIDLSDAHLAFTVQGRFVRADVGAITMRGLPAWGQTAILSPIARAFVVTFSGAGSAALALVVVLALAQGVRRVGRIASVLVGAAGPLAALGAMRALERSEASAAAFVFVPIAAALAAIVAGLVMRQVERLPSRRRTATN